MIQEINGNDIRFWDLLTITEVADLLKCCVRTVREIPDHQLAVHRVGKENLYFRADVIRYVRLYCRVGAQAPAAVDQLLSEIQEDVVGSPLDGVRERSRRRTP